MMKKLWILGLFILTATISSGAVNNYSSEWKVTGISSDGGLMIVYKSLAPLSLTVEDPKTMKIPKGIKEFTYSQITGGRPLKVSVQTKYNSTINNELDKNIIKTIYDSVKFGFESTYTSGSNNFKLDYFSQKGENYSENEKIEKYINGRAYFTNLNAVETGNTDSKQLSDNIKVGTLTAETYLDAKFTVPDSVQLLGGETYRGTLRVKAEFLGKNPLP